MKSWGREGCGGIEGFGGTFCGILGGRVEVVLNGGGWMGSVGERGVNCWNEGGVCVWTA
jgi:hypothetical protein